MRGGAIIREARRRAALSQRELAQRLGTAQSVVARWERGTTSPSFDTVVGVVRACGYELDVHLVPIDEGFEHDWSLTEQNLALTPEQRLANHDRAVRFAEDLRRGRKAAAGSGSRG